MRTPADQPKWMTYTGWAFSVLVILFMLMDLTMKYLQLPIVITTTEGLGWPAASVVPLAIILTVCTLLYAWPQAAVLGAILLTGYLGGAVATHMRIGSPLFSHELFGVYLGLFAWGGLFLRDARLRALIPLRR